MKRGDLKILRTLADKKLRKLGISLDYRIEPSRGGSEASDQGQPIRYDSRDARMPDGAESGKLYLLLHELGHKYQTQRISMAVRDSDEFTNLFGRYHKPYRRKPGVKPERSDFISKYAQTHPQETFAEAFSIYALYEGDPKKIADFLRRKKKDSKVLAQISWIDRHIKQNG